MSQALEIRRFKTLASQLGEAVVITDPEGRITWSNSAFTELCGYSGEEVLGRRPGIFLQGEDSDPATVRRLREAVAARKPLCTEILNYHKSGRPYWVRISLNPIRDEQGATIGFVALEHDVSDVKGRQQSLEGEVVTLYGALLKSFGGQGPAAQPSDPFLRA